MAASACVEGQCVGSPSNTSAPRAMGGSVISTCQKVSDRPMPDQFVRFTTNVPTAQQKPASSPQNRPSGAEA